MSDSTLAFREAKSDVFFFRWVFGWHPIVGWGIIILLLAGIGYFFGETERMALVGLLIGGPIWYQGTKYIDRHADSVISGYLDDVKDFGPQVLESAGMDEEGEWFLLTMTPDGSRPFVSAPYQVDATLVGLDGDGIWIYDETTLDLTFLKAVIRTDPENVVHVPFSNLERIDFEEGVLTIEPKETTADLETYRTPLDTVPGVLLEAVEDRTTQ